MPLALFDDTVLLKDLLPRSLSGARLAHIWQKDDVAEQPMFEREKVQSIGAVRPLSRM